ncbi:leukotriene C4 synthase-like isoform X2 [Ascaphus truei]|uniref:leukotriene C4 synthase-like isoform X2 n=1 Tax=Ascaphus truei TaxID=8439 RepID=UPI003F5AC339
MSPPLMTSASDVYSRWPFRVRLRFIRGGGVNQRTRWKDKIKKSLNMSSPGHTMLHQIALLGAVTLLGVLEQAYFALKVIAARRNYGVSPPSTSGPPEFERVFRAQINCTEYFPMFLAVLWLAGIFFNQAAAVNGQLYLFFRYRYFKGYVSSSQGRLGPMYMNAGFLLVLLGQSAAGILHVLFSHYLGWEILSFFIPAKDL